MPSVIKSYFINDVKPGMVLARDIISMRGIVMLSAKTVLTEQTIERMEHLGLVTVEILEENKSASDGEHEKKAADELKQSFSQHYTAIVEQVKDAFKSARYCKRIPLDQLRDVSDQISESLVNSKGVINYLHILQLIDDYTFQHSVNVAILSGLFGRWLGVSYSEVKELVFSGILHDIGKTQIPLEILNKPGKLTEDEMNIMKRHSVIGCEMLKRSDFTTPEVIDAVWSHHERLDGSGYPRGLKDSQISRNAKIISVADIYDAMTSDRVYRRSVTPFDVIETISSEMFNKLDPTLCTVISNYLQDFFIGNIVLLNDGRRAEVIYIDKTRDSRPVVRTDEGEYINLEMNRKITIVDVLG